MPKSRAQFTPMRTTAADSRTKIVITLDTKCRPNTLFENRLLVKRSIKRSKRPVSHEKMARKLPRLGVQLSCISAVDVKLLIVMDHTNPHDVFEYRILRSHRIFDDGMRFFG
jgi:hypothetical protein